MLRRFTRWVKQVAQDPVGGFDTGSFAVIVLGVIWLVIGLVLSGPVLSQAATSGSSANIGSFSGARSFNDLVPLIYYAVVVVGGVGLMAAGGIRLIRGSK